MELKINSKCQIIIDDFELPLGIMIHDGKEVEIKEENGIYYCNVEKDGLYSYFAVDPDKAVKADAEIFSICNLRNCLLNLERKIVNNTLNECSKGLCKDTLETNVEDFLLTSIFVLENLICKGNYSEADRIVKLLDNCDLCKNVSKKCNCNE